MNNVQNIEKTFSSKASYFISFKLNKKDGRILDFNSYNLEAIFSKKRLSKNNIDIEKLLTKYVNKNDKLFLKYKNDFDELNINEIPIWSLCLMWTFGITMDLFKCLNSGLQNEIINSYKHVNWEIEEFIVIMEFLKKIRNITAHNNVLYNIKFKVFINKIQKFIINNKINLKLNSNGLHLYDIVKIIDKISNKDNKNNSLKNVFDRKTINNIVNENLIPKESKEYILNKINFIK